MHELLHSSYAKSKTISYCNIIICNLLAKVFIVSTLVLPCNILIALVFVLARCLHSNKNMTIQKDKDQMLTLSRDTIINSSDEEIKDMLRDMIKCIQEESKKTHPSKPAEPMPVPSGYIAKDGCGVVVGDVVRLYDNDNELFEIIKIKVWGKSRMLTLKDTVTGKLFRSTIKIWSTVWVTKESQ